MTDADYLKKNLATRQAISGNENCDYEEVAVAVVVVGVGVVLALSVLSVVVSYRRC